VTLRDYRVFLWLKVSLEVGCYVVPMKRLEKGEIFL